MGSITTHVSLEIVLLEINNDRYCRIGHIFQRIYTYYLFHEFQYILDFTSLFFMSYSSFPACT